MDRRLILNYFYNILYQLVKIILPMIVVPYTAKHLGEGALSIYQFAGSVMNWFILFGILGVNTYGNRQIAKVRDNREELNSTFFEIFAMQVCNMLIAMLAYFAYIQVTVHENLLMWQLTGLTMIASMLDITWFFYGVEDFKKASIRNIIVKILGVSLIMLLVKKPEDLWMYILINVGSELIGQAIMFVQLKQYIGFSRISLRDAYTHHFRATFQLFVPTIAISVYTLFDQPMIGYLYKREHVTYYQTAMNFVKMFLYFITSIGSVLLPRVTNVYYNDEHGAEKAQGLVNTTMKIACLLAFPMCFGMMAIAPVFISWYLPQWPIVADLIRIGAPIIIFISMSNVTGIQYMVPTGMYNKYSASVIAGSVINFITNLILIPRFGAYGAIAASLLAEMTVTVIQFVLVRKVCRINLLTKSYCVYLIGSVLMLGAVIGAGQFLPRSVIGTLVQIAAGMLVYFIILVISREELCMKVLAKLGGGRVHA